MSVTYNPNTTIHNGGYQTSSGTVSTITLTGAGTNGAYLTTGPTGAVWTTPNTHFNSSQGNPVLTIPHGEDKVIVEDRAELEVKGRIKLNGVDLDERLKTIETILAIPERDPEVEARHPKLKELYDEYIRALAKYRTWDTLKDSK